MSDDIVLTFRLCPDCHGLSDDGDCGVCLGHHYITRDPEWGGIARAAQDDGPMAFLDHSSAFHACELCSGGAA